MGILEILEVVVWINMVFMRVVTTVLVCRRHKLLNGMLHMDPLQAFHEVGLHFDEKESDTLFHYWKASGHHHLDLRKFVKSILEKEKLADEKVEEILQELSKSAKLHSVWHCT